MKTLKNIRKPLTPKRSLEKQVSWLPDHFECFPKSPNSSLTIALIAGERIYWSMQYEGQALSLTESNWQWVLKYGGVDLLLIESCSETATGDWFMAQTARNLEDSLFGRMVRYAQQKKIPVAYWFTLDVQYLPLYQPAIEWFGKVYCADDRVITALDETDVETHYLPPAVQPAYFTKLNEYSPEKKKLHRVVCDDLVSVIQSREGREDFYQNLQEFGARFFDSRNQMWNTKTKVLELKPETVLGTVDFSSCAELFRRARTLGILRSRSRTRTDMQWSILEAAASHMTVLLEPGVEVGEFEAMCLVPESQDDFFVELVRHDRDSLYCERIAQKTWREALLKHTYSHRLQTICQNLGIDHDWMEFPAVAMVTPSYRKKFLDRARENFARQTYPNKNWVLVFNGPIEEFEDVKTAVCSLNMSQAIYVPEELHAGPCMNAGIQKARAEYVFRMDDDDHYGSNYLLDLMLYTRICHFDVIGKSFRWFTLKEKYPSSVFYRTADKIGFEKPAFCTARKLPTKVSFLAGCSQGGRRAFFIDNPYPGKNFGSVDSQWLDSLREIGAAKIICVDDHNMVVDRRDNGDHTWSANMDPFIRNSINISVSKVEEVFL